jgi:HAD domain in Swiss Army Knife RNA repair proteins
MSGPRVHREGCKVLFLDFDGVLNTYASHDTLVIEPTKVARLNRITDVTGAEIVVSSAWRNALKLPALRVALNRSGVTAHVLAATPTIPERSRGDEIRWWLDRPGRLERVRSYVVLDDNSLGYPTPHADHPFVHTVQLRRDGERLLYRRGLRDEHVERAITFLNGSRR